MMTDEDFDIEKIEPGIREVVKYLRGCGFSTFASCEGGPDHPRERAWVRLNYSIEGIDLKEQRKYIARSLIKGGYRGFSMIELYEHNSDFDCDVFSLIEVEFWSPKPEEDRLPKAEAMAYYQALCRKKKAEMIRKPDKIMISDDSLHELNCAAEWVDHCFTKEGANEFLLKNPDLYHEGCRWGFSDTVVREAICKRLTDTKKQLSIQQR